MLLTDEYKRHPKDSSQPCAATGVREGIVSIRPGRSVASNETTEGESGSSSTLKKPELMEIFDMSLESLLSRSLKGSPSTPNRGGCNGTTDSVAVVLALATVNLLQLCY